MGGRKMLYLLVLSLLLISLSSTFVSAEITDQLKGEGSQSRLTTTSAEECISSSSSTSTVDVTTNICYVVVTGTSTVTETTFANYEKVNGKWQGEGRFIQDTLNDDFYRYEDYSLVPSRETCRTIRFEEDTCVDGSCMKCTKTIGYPAGCASHLERAEECNSIGSSSFINPVTKLSSHSSYSTNSQQSCSGDVSITTRTGSYSETDNSCYTNRAGNSQCGPVRYFSTSAQVTDGVCSVDKCTEGFDLCGTCGGDVTEITWSGPSVNDVSCGIPVIQINSCGEVRTLEGAKDCCTDTSWDPDSSEVCYGDRFYQTSNCGTSRLAFGTLLDETYCTIPPSTVTPACGDVSRTYDTTELFFNSSTYCDSGIVSEIPSYPTPDNSVSWNCIGTDSTISCSASRLACDSGFEWNETSNTCEELSVPPSTPPSTPPDIPSDPGNSRASDSVICTAEAIDPDGDAVSYDYTWYYVDSEGELVFIQNDPELGVSRFQLQNNIYLCEVYATDGEENSLVQRKVATLQTDRSYVPYGVLEIDVSQIGDYKSKDTIPQNVEVSDAFRYSANIACLYGECPNMQASLMYNQNYLFASDGANIIYPYISQGHYIASMILFPNQFMAFESIISSNASSPYNTTVTSDEYTIVHDEVEANILDYARFLVKTNIILSNGNVIETFNRSVILPDSTAYVEQESILQIQDKLLLADSFNVSLQEYMLYSISDDSDSGIVQDPALLNRFSFTNSGTYTVNANVQESVLDPGYLKTLVNSISNSRDTTFYYESYCQDYSLSTNELNYPLMDFDKGSEIFIEVSKNTEGVSDLITDSSALSFSFNDVFLQERFGSNWSDFKNQLTIIENGECSGIQDCFVAKIVPSETFDSLTFQSLIKNTGYRGNLGLGSGFLNNSLHFTYLDPLCGGTKHGITDITFNRAPFVKIESPINRLAYYNNTEIEFSSYVVDPEGDPFDLNWTIYKDNYKSNLANFNYTFTSPGQSIITLVGTDSHGEISFDTVIIGISASPLVLAYIDNPEFWSTVSSETGLVNFNGSGTYAINSIIGPGCTDPVVTCLAGDCPPTTGNSPTSCSQETLQITNPPENTPPSFDDLLFDWNFTDIDVIESGLGLNTGSISYQDDGNKIIKLRATYSKDGIEIDSSTFTEFTLNYDPSDCKYDSTPKQRTHYSKIDDSHIGSVGLKLDCGGTVTDIPMRRISFESSNTAVANNFKISNQNSGAYEVLSEGTAVLHIRHNNIDTGLNITVAGVCGIKGIALNESMFGILYNKGETEDITPITTIKSSACLDSDRCIFDVSEYANSLNIIKTSLSDRVTFSKNTYPEFEVTNCGVSGDSEVGFDIEYNPSSQFFCDSTLRVSDAVRLADSDYRRAFCEDSDKSADLSSHVLLKTREKYGVANNDLDGDTTRNKLAIVSRAVSSVFKDDAIRVYLQEYQPVTFNIAGTGMRGAVEIPSLLNTITIPANRFDDTGTTGDSSIQITYDEYIQALCEQSITHEYNLSRDLLRDDITSFHFIDNFLPDYSDVCFELVTEELADSKRQLYKTNTNSKICAVPLNTSDVACCTDNQCVYGGTCFDPGVVIDIDNDGLNETCIIGGDN